MLDALLPILVPSVLGMPKEKYDPPDPRRMYTIMSSEEAANGKKSYWAELEISGESGCDCLCEFVFRNCIPLITSIKCNEEPSARRRSGLLQPFHTAEASPFGGHVLRKAVLQPLLYS